MQRRVHGFRQRRQNIDPDIGNLAIEKEELGVFGHGRDYYNRRRTGWFITWGKPCRSRLKRRLQARVPAPRLEHDSRLLRFGFRGVDAGDFQQFFETPQRAMFLAVIQQGAHLRDGESQNRPYFRKWRRVDAHRGVLAEVPRQVLDHRFDFRWRAFGAALHHVRHRIRPFLAGQARLAKVARIVALQADPGDHLPGGAVWQVGGVLLVGGRRAGRHQQRDRECQPHGLLDDGDGFGQPFVGRRSSHEDLDRPRFGRPGVSSLIPISERTRLQWDPYRLSTPVRNRHPLEARQLFQGTLHLRPGEADVHLHHLVAIPRAGVGDIYDYQDLAALPQARSTHPQPRILECRVAKTVAERIKRLAFEIEIRAAVADVVVHHGRQLIDGTYRSEE